jgi:uncharacterized membrane protein (DUF2068 family)
MRPKRSAKTVSIVVGTCSLVIGLNYLHYPPLAAVYLASAVAFVVAGLATNWSSRSFLLVGAALYIGLGVLGLVVHQIVRSVIALSFGLAIVGSMLLTRFNRSRPSKG